MHRLLAALDAVDLAMEGVTEPKWLLIAAKCKGLMRGYHSRWQNAPYRVESADDVECLVESDLWNPETERKSRSFRVAGKIDLRAWEGTRRVIFDHKTTGDDISDPAAPFWRQLVVERQPSHYELLEWLNGRKVDMAVWDVVRKPGISPRQLSKKERELIAFTQTYGGQKLSEESIEEANRSERETLEMYELRLAADCTTDRPQWYFQRRPVPRLDSEILEHAKELWEHGQEILHVRNTNRHTRNSGACMQYKSPCRFLGICSGYDTPDSDNWQRKKQVHAELPMLQGDGRDVLTNSRIACFQTCRKKHYFDFELGIERQDEEEREALYFGQIWHAAQEAWWLASVERKEEHGDNCNTSPVHVAAGTGSVNPADASL